MAALTVQLEDCPRLVGSVHVGEPFRVDPEECELFERSTRIHDLYPPERPTGYPEAMIAGFHTLGLLEYALEGALRFDPERQLTYFYGLDRVRFPSFATTEDELVLTLRVESVEPRDGGYLMTYELELCTPGGAKPVLVARTLTLVLPADDAGH
jgi:hypothetical protein